MRFRDFLTPLIFLTLATPASATVVLNEVQISPIDARFMELYNTGNSDIDLTGWYIQRKTASGSSFGSLVTSPNFEGKSIKAGGYFLISRSSLSGSGMVIGDLTLTESNSIQIKNSAREVVDQIGWGSINEAESYQRTSSGEWMIASPTPGAPNGAGSNTNTTVVSQQGASGTSTQTTTIGANSAFPVEPQIFASAGEKKRTVIVGADFTLSGSVWGLKKEPIENARMLWNWGDGSTGEGKSVLHAYHYPGTYTVTLDASSGYYAASDKVTIEAVPAQVLISSVGNIQAPYVELSNASSYELDLSFWSIHADTRSFIIPNHTLLASNKSVKFADEITKLSAHNARDVSLYYPNGVLAVSYHPNIPEASKEQKQQVVINQKSTAIAKQPAQQKIDPTKNKQILAGVSSVGEDAITASFDGDAQRAIVAGTEHKPADLFWWIMGVLGLALTGVAGAFFTKQGPVVETVQSEADKYEIIEEIEDDKIPF